MSSPIFDLPMEMIAHIFSFVSHKKDRRNLALICKQFNEIVRQQSKQHNCLDLSRNLEKYYPFVQSDEFPFQKIHLEYEQIEQYRDVLQKHGVDITQMTLDCGFEEFVTLGSELKELFPNLTTLNFYFFFYQPNSIEVKSFFSENIKNLDLTFNNWQLKLLGWILELFPGLKHLKLKIRVCTNQNDSEIQEFKDFLDKWLPQLEKIELSFDASFDRLQLLGAFEGCIDEKLTFENLGIKLSQNNINILKDFFSLTRHVKSLKISYMHTDLDSTLYSLIEKNAKIDRLIISSDIHLYYLRFFINAPGIKEIYFNDFGIVNLRDCFHFTPETLLKVKRIKVRGDINESVLSIPLFRNVRELSLTNFEVGNEELAFIVNNFPLLEVLNVYDLSATNGRLLTNLKHIRHLETCYCPDLSDAFFDFGAILPNLEVLCLRQVPNLTLNGIKSIVANCPRIQTMTLCQCEQITEECIDLVAQKLFYIERILMYSIGQHSLFCTLKKKYPRLIY